MKTLRNVFVMVVLLVLLAAAALQARPTPSLAMQPNDAPAASGVIQAGEATVPAGTPVQLELLSAPPELTPEQQAVLEAYLARGPRHSSLLSEGTTAVQRPDSQVHPASETTLPLADEALLAPDSPGAFTLYRDTQATSLKPYTALVPAPTVANSGPIVLMTGNWYAAISTDGGRTFSFINPATLFPIGAGVFCCNQVVVYEPARDLFIWYLQYYASGSPGSGQNIFRIAAARPQEAAQGQWVTWDFPSDANTEWDYPDMCLSNDYLWITTNRAPFQSGVANDAWMFKMPLDSIMAGGAFGYGYIDLGAYGITNLNLRCTRGARETMYFGSHNSTSQIRIFRWAENSGTVGWDDVNLSASWGNAMHTCPGPDGLDWCGSDTGRVLAAWVSQGRIGFLWGASQGGGFVYPYIEAVRVRESDRAYIDRPFLWSSSRAYAYPSAHPNARGDVGLAFYFGGGSYYPYLAMAIDDDYSRDASYLPPPWEVKAVRQSSQGPNMNWWGNYISVQPFAPTGLGWIAAGYTMQGCGSQGCSEPSYTIFGRERDLRSVALYYDPRYATLLPLMRK